jgi:hypothetical protein
MANFDHPFLLLVNSISTICFLHHSYRHFLSTLSRILSCKKKKIEERKMKKKQEGRKEGRSKGEGKRTQEK